MIRFRSMLLLALVTTLGTAASAPAAAQKVGYIASEAIMNRLPEVRAARAKLAELQATWSREIQRQEGDMAALRVEIETNRLLWSSQERRDAEARLRDMESKLAAYRNTKYGPDGEYEREHAQLMKPVFDRVWKAIEEEAKAQKIDIVLDKSSRGMPMVYASPEFDLTYAVLQRLGVKIDPSEMPAVEQPRTDNEGSARSNRGRRGRGDSTTRPDTESDPNRILQPDGETEPPPGEKENPE
jgi:outer membrane protein